LRFSIAHFAFKAFALVLAFAFLVVIPEGDLLLSLLLLFGLAAGFSPR